MALSSPGVHPVWLPYEVSVTVKHQDAISHNLDRNSDDQFFNLEAWP